MESVTISSLCDEGSIQGKTFLFCVEHNIEKVEDLNMSLLENADEDIVEELKQFMPSLVAENSNEQTDALSDNNSDNASSSNEGNEVVSLREIDQYLDDTQNLTYWIGVYTRILSKVDDKTRNFLFRKKMSYKTSDAEFLKYMISLNNEENKIKLERYFNQKKTSLQIIDVAQNLYSRFSSFISHNKMIEGLEDVLSEHKDQIESLFLRDKIEISERAQNCVDSLLEICDGSLLKFYKMICMPDFSVYNLRNVGTKTAPEISSFISCFIDDIYTFIEGRDEEVIEKTVDSSNEKLDISEFKNVQNIEPLIRLRLKNLSRRSQNVILDLYKSCDRSILKLYNFINKPDFVISSLHNVGDKTEIELKEFLLTFENLVRDRINNRDNVNDETILKLQWTQNQIVNSDFVDALYEKYCSLGYFPLFSCVYYFIQSLEYRDRLMLEAIFIFNNQKLRSKEELAKTLSVSEERIRQLRNKIFKDLKKFIADLFEKANINESIYNLSNIKLIVQNENYNFSLNFIKWAMSVCIHKIKIIGNVSSAFCNQNNDENHLFFYPVDLDQIFNFKAFLSSFDNVYNEKHYDEREIDLTKFIYSFFVNGINIERFSEILDLCKLFITRKYFCSISSDNIILMKGNLYKALSDIVEDILRENGKAMTKDEIYDAVCKTYPDRKYEKNSIGGVSSLNKNILPIGRSSVYTLAEWQHGSKRGGTIRDFAMEYLGTLSKPIASIKDITNYILPFRPNTNEKSVCANLLADSKNKFSLFFKDNQKYIGLSSEEYDISYERVNTEISFRRDFSTSITILQKFVIEHNRFPSSSPSNGDEELRLYRFWLVNKKKYDNNKLSDEEMSMMDDVLTKLGHLETPQSDEIWKDNYTTIKKLLIKSGSKDLSRQQKQWFYNNKRLLEQEKLEKWKCFFISQLIKLW